MSNTLLSPEVIRIRMPARDKQDLLDKMVNLLEGQEGVRDLEVVRKAIHQREAEVSTGVGFGLGLPHARTDAVTKTLASFATTEEPVPYDSIDEIPVQIVLLIVGPTRAASEHLKLLSQVSRLMNKLEVRGALLRASGPQEILDWLRVTTSRNALS
jgi:PTS system fructose-specific IIA component